MKYEYIRFLGQERAVPAGLPVWAENHHYYERLRSELMMTLSSAFSDVNNWPASPHRVAREEILKIGRKHREHLESYGVKHHYEDLTGKAYDELDDLLYKVDEKITALIMKHIDALDASFGKPLYYQGPSYKYNPRGILDLSDWFDVEGCLSDCFLYKPINYGMSFGPSAANLGPDIRKYPYKLSFCQNVWVPKLRNVVNKYVTRLFKDFWDTICLYNPGYKGADKQLHIDLSNGELNCLEWANDISLTLSSAFDACPFNKDVYIKCLEHGLCGKDEVAAAKLFCVDAPLLNTAKKNCVSEIERNAREEQITENLRLYANIISELDGGSPEEIVQQHISTLRDRYIKSLNEATNVSLDSPEFDNLMRTRISVNEGDLDEIIRAGQNDSFLRNTFDSYVSGMVHDYDSDFFRREKRKRVDALVKKALTYSREAKSRRDAFIKDRDRHHTLEKKSLAEISALEKELAELFFLKFGRKKEAKSRITLLKNELEKSAVQLKTKERFFNEMYLFN